MATKYSKRKDTNLLNKVNSILKEQVKQLSKQTVLPLEVHFYPREEIPEDILHFYVDIKQELNRREKGSSKQKTKTEKKVLLPTKLTIASNVKTLVGFHDPDLIKEVEKRNLDILSSLKL